MLVATVLVMRLAIARWHFAGCVKSVQIHRRVLENGRMKAISNKYWCVSS